MNVKSLLVCATAAIASLLSAGLAHADDEPILLRHQYEKDHPLLYRTTSEMEQTQSLMGQKITMTMKQTDVTQRSLEMVNDDGNLRVKSENKQLMVTMKSAIGEYKFDSKGAERERGSVLGAALTPIYERLSGSALTMVITPRGEVKDVEGLDMLLADVLKDNALGAQFAGGGSKGAARLSQQESSDQLPEQPVKKGDKWEIPYEMELPKLGKVTGKRIYTFEDFDKVGERETVRLGVTLEMAFDVAVEMGGAKVTGKMAVSDSSGTVHFDPKRGQTVSKKAKYTIGGDLSVDVAGNIIPVRQDQTQAVTVELIEKLPE
jgi:hypothetical protein